MNERGSFDTISISYIIVSAGNAMLSDCYQEILELAVLEACVDELKRLKKQTTEHQISQSIHDGLTELEKLQSGSKPDYDHPWVPLLHASWYHLKHVNFLQTELADRLKQHNGSDVIRIVDFGCGTMPVMWAIALVLADPDNQLTQQSVCVENIDTSDNMKGLGYGLRAKLKGVVKSRQDLDAGRRLYHAIDRVTESETGFDSDAHLLTAIHCLYDKQSCEELKKIPVEGKCVMLHAVKAKKLGLRENKPIGQQWSGNLEKLTEFRKQQIGGLCLNTIPDNLINSVKWDSGYAVVLVDI